MKRNRRKVVIRAAGFMRWNDIIAPRGCYTSLLIRGHEWGLRDREGDLYDLYTTNKVVAMSKAKLQMITHAAYAKAMKRAGWADSATCNPNRPRIKMLTRSGVAVIDHRRPLP